MWPETESWLSPSKKQRRYPFSGPPPLYQDLSTCYDWPVKRPLSIFQSRWKELRNARPVIRWVCASQPRVTNRDFNFMYVTQANNVSSLVFSFTETKSSGRNKKNLAYLRKFSLSGSDCCESCHTPEPLHNGHLGDRTRGGRGGRLATPSSISIILHKILSLIH